MWMPPRTSTPPFLSALNAAGTITPPSYLHQPERLRPQRCRDNLSGWCKYDGGVQLIRRSIIGASGPHRAQLQREFLVTNIACGSKHIHIPVPCHLDRHVSCRAKPIKAQASARFDPREPQRPEPNDSRTKQRRGLFIG